MKDIAVLGSTGSIGTQTLDVAEKLNIPIKALTANSSVDLIERQARKFKPEMAVLADEKAASDLKIKLADTDVRVYGGSEALCEAACIASTVVTAMVGIAGLRPTFAAIDAGRTIALANKETLVCAGELVMRRAMEKGLAILPVDSEHSAIFQCLNGEKRSQLKKILLTASGGPFFGKSREEMYGYTKENALKHPNWVMGAKITIDSATMMNKGFEFIEAMHLYGVEPEQIEIVVHRESIIHSAVEYDDSAVIAQLSNPDMRLPIQYALTYPDRLPCPVKPLDLFSIGKLTFYPADTTTFPCLKLALDAAKQGGTSCAIVNGANEVAVARFLHDEIKFGQIAELVQKAVETVKSVPITCPDDVFSADAAAREAVRR